MKALLVFLVLLLGSTVVAHADDPAPTITSPNTQLYPNKGFGGGTANTALPVTIAPGGLDAKITVRGTDYSISLGDIALWSVNSLQKSDLNTAGGVPQLDANKNLTNNLLSVYGRFTSRVETPSLGISTGGSITFDDGGVIYRNSDDGTIDIPNLSASTFSAYGSVNLGAVSISRVLTQNAPLIVGQNQTVVFSGGSKSVAMNYDTTNSRMMMSLDSSSYWSFGGNLVTQGFLSGQSTAAGSYRLGTSIFEGSWGLPDSYLTDGTSIAYNQLGYADIGGSVGQSHETDYINIHPSGAGGFSWCDGTTIDGCKGHIMMSLDASKNLLHTVGDITTDGDITANGDLTGNNIRSAGRIYPSDDIEMPAGKSLTFTDAGDNWEIYYYYDMDYGGITIRPGEGDLKMQVKGAFTANSLNTTGAITATGPVNYETTYVMTGATNNSVINLSYNGKPLSADTCPLPPLHGQAIVDFYVTANSTDNVSQITRSWFRVYIQHPNSGPVISGSNGGDFNAINFNGGSWVGSLTTDSSTGCPVVQVGTSQSKTFNWVGYARASFTMATSTPTGDAAGQQISTVDANKGW